MRLLQLSSVLPPVRDGIGDATAGIHRMLRSHGHEAFIGTSADQAPGDGIFPVVPRWSARALRPLLRLCRTLGIRTVLMHYPSPGYGRSLSLALLPWVLRLSGRWLLVFVHEYVTYSRLGKLRLFLMLLPAHAIVTSDSVNMAALRALPFRRAPVFLYPTGCSIPVTDEKPPRERRPQGGRLRVLFFGLIQKGKGVDALLSAFAQSPELRRRAELHVIGGLGAAPTAPERELHAQLLRLPYVVAHGFVPAESLGAHFHDMDVMIVPFENGVTERRTSFMAGLAFGLPVITTRPSVPLEGLQHMGNVILMEEASPRSIEHAIDATAGLDCQELGTIGAMGRQWYEKRFSEEILYSRFRAIEDSLTHH